MASETHIHTCPLCEATCGLAIEVDPRERTVLSVRGDADDVFSGGFACPKGLSIGALHADPDRLTQPLVDGQEVSWDQAWETVEERLMGLIEAHGRDVVAMYLGNPNVHNLAGAYTTPAVAKALGSPYVFTATTVDQQPKHVSAALMFGHKLSIPIPDIDRTDYLLVLGADPMTSNGSLMTAPDMPGRLRALRQRGGRLVVVDPRVSRTARAADEHIGIRPGTDALWLAAIAQTLLASGTASPPVEGVAGLEVLPEALAPFTPEAVAGPTRVPAEVTRRVAGELAAAPSAAVYGRLGTTTVAFGTTTSWLVDVINVLTGNLDRPGGAMFTTAAAGQTNSSSGAAARETRFGRYHTAVRGLPEVFSELPSAAFAEELLDGPVRGLITIAGNPALSVPNGDRVAEALTGLDVMISVDCYRNETTRHADVVLPIPSVLQRSHYDVAFMQLAIRNVANWSDPVFETDQPQEWEVHARLAGILRGLGAACDVDAVDTFVLSTHIQKEVTAASSPIAGKEPSWVLDQLGERRGPERWLDFLIRVGPFGDGFGSVPDGLTLDEVQWHPHGLDLGPLEPRLPEVLLTPSGEVDVAPQAIIEDLPRLVATLEQDPDGLLLVGRRHLRSNNSWGHNVEALLGGTNRSSLQMHPEDAEARGLADEGRARVTSKTGTVEVVVEVTERITPGTVSLPHGWGHDVDGVQLSVATEHPGVNPNVLTGPDVDPLSGNAILNGVQVTVEPAPLSVG
ncbi:molybdopterin-dependent oxidoreductase [Euzebya tangerina]|uniref:molybdopterin-dependent oxidoreductase n=1 Tax=Euzebya tangerina TaxID=591198 RepID=UPI000E323CAB|nr:molybdopterin-dependent oxidoreductase [Euzebya tangerina]